MGNIISLNGELTIFKEEKAEAMFPWIPFILIFLLIAVGILIAILFRRRHSSPNRVASMSAHFTRNGADSPTVTFSRNRPTYHPRANWRTGAVFIAILFLFLLYFDPVEPKSFYFRGGKGKLSRAFKAVRKVAKYSAPIDIPTTIMGAAVYFLRNIGMDEENAPVLIIVVGTISAGTFVSLVITVAILLYRSLCGHSQRFSNVLPTSQTANPNVIEMNEFNSDPPNRILIKSH